MTFLSVITRCYKRPNMLEANRDSLKMQTDQDYEQITIVDDVGRGVGWANRALRDVAPAGDYVLILDDDDLLTEPTALEELREAASDKPEMVVFKCDHGRLGTLPDALVWEGRPRLGHIGSCSFISRRDVWEKHIDRFGANNAGDFFYLFSVWEDDPGVVWLDRKLAGVQRISRGRPE